MGFLAVRCLQQACHAPKQQSHYEKKRKYLPNAAAASNVTIIPSRPDNLQTALEEVQFSQIDLGYRYSALAIANALMSYVGAIFPQHMILIYLTTSHKRKQVWHAYIAAMFANPANPQPITDPDAVRARLVNTSSKELLHEAYGDVPEGLVQTLGRLELKGQEPHIYLLMHKFISKSATLRKSFSHASKIKASTIITLAALPAPLQSYDLASQCRGPKDIKALLFMVKALARGDEVKYAEICEQVVAAASRNHSISAVLKRYYYLTKFPESGFSDTEFCKHIGNAFELKKAAKQFQNCLSDYVEEGIRGEYQYYRWFESGQIAAIVSLREDSPFGHRLTEIQGMRNEPIDHELELKIIRHFESHGVHKQPSLEALIRQLGYLGVVNRGRRGDPVDQIDDEIHGLLNDDPV